MLSLSTNFKLTDQMPSNFIKVILALTGLSPALFLLYVIKVVNASPKLSIYFNCSSFGQVIKEGCNFFQNNYLIILFIFLVFLARHIVRFARKNFAIGRIEVKSIKPGDSNFTTIIFSAIPLIVKLCAPDMPDGILVSAFFLVGIVLGLTMKSSYHFNLILKLILGYSHYEIQTREEVTYLMISKKKLINKKEITQYVNLADHMLINVSDKN